MSKRYMRAYYNTFTPTGNDAVDAILEAVALAGKAYHNTSEWSEPVEYGKPEGPCFWDLIQETANNAAKVLRPEDVAIKEACEIMQKIKDDVRYCDLAWDGTNLLIDRFLERHLPQKDHE